MTSRRKLLSLLAGLPFVGWLVAKPKLPSSSEILKSFDARDWAKAFVAHVHQIPCIATDEGTMTGWFANALMRGYDEREAHLRKTLGPNTGHSWSEQLTITELRGACARGYCSDANRNKVLDGDLLEAIVQELIKL